MFAQDLGTEIWAQFNPLDRRYEQRSIQPVLIENCSADLSEVLINCLPYNTYGENLSGAISGFAQLVAQELVLHGKAFFEVRGGWDRSIVPPRLREAALVWVPYDSIIRLGPWAFQVVPPGTEHEESVGRVIRLDGSRVAGFVPPRSWRRALARIRLGLPILGRSEHGWMMGITQLKVAEDFKAVIRGYDIQRARVTASIGWNARQRFKDHIADFQWTTRELRWRRFCIEVRDAILTKVSEVFALIGSWVGEQPHLVWDQLPSGKHLEEGEQRLMGKGASFNEILRTPM